MPVFLRTYLKSKNKYAELYKKKTKQFQHNSTAIIVSAIATAFWWSFPKE